MGCRNNAQAKQAIDTIDNLTHKSRCSYMHLDLTDYENIKSFVEEIKSKYGKIDILIINAGSCFRNFTLSDPVKNAVFLQVYKSCGVYSSTSLEYFRSCGIYSITPVDSLYLFIKEFIFLYYYYLYLI